MPARLNDLGARLAALPDRVPPAGGWNAVLAARQRRRPARARRWPALFAAAAVAGSAGLAVLVTRDQPALAPTPVGDQGLAASDALRRENARLEVLLASLPQRRAIRGSTALTIATLEDRLAAVDYRLTVTMLEPHAPESADRLWRERAGLLDTLVKVRTADLAGSYY